MTDLFDRAAHGGDLRVDQARIEETLAELWRVEKDSDHAITRAALWNVVAHTALPAHHGQASEVLCKAASSVPQRTILIRADPAAPAELSSWISANCHLMAEGKQVCSEEIAIIAGGDGVDRVPPLVNALLIPDMPVALWWIGDLPHDRADYVNALLEPADRLIIDSVNFDHAADLELVNGVAARTATAPADLNWFRLEDWRVAAASIFDPPEMRGKIGSLRRLRVVSDAVDESFFGNRIEPLFFVSWLLGQAGLVQPDGTSGVECSFEFTRSERTGLSLVELELEGSSATIARDADRGVLTTNVDGHVNVPDNVTRSRPFNLGELVVRALKQPDSDALLLKVLPVAIGMAARVR